MWQVIHREAHRKLHTGSNGKERSYCYLMGTGSIHWAGPSRMGRFVNIGGGQGRLLAKQNECEQDRKEVKAC